MWYGFQIYRVWGWGFLGVVGYAFEFGAFDLVGQSCLMLTCCVFRVYCLNCWVGWVIVMVVLHTFWVSVYLLEFSV